MAKLNLQTTLSSSLGARRFLLRPAEPSVQDLLPSSTGVYLGRTQLLNVPVFWDFSTLANPHIAVVGMTGSGKSYFIKSFITRAHRTWGTGAVILDWSGEYSPWVKNAGGDVIPIASIGLNILDCRPSCAKTISKTTPAQHITQVISSLSILSELSAHPRQARYIKKALEEAFAKKKISLNKPLSAKTDARKIPCLLDAYSTLSLWLKDKHDDDLESAHDLLERFCQKGADCLARSGGLNPASLVSDRLISIDLSSMQSDFARSLAALYILQYLKEAMRIFGLPEKAGLRLIIVADEAWKIAQDDRTDLVQILREGRKYSFSLVVASQNPSDISKTILSNAGTLAVFRLMHADFRESLLASLNCGKDVSAQMEKFKVGQALFRMAWAKPSDYDGPFIISRIEGEDLNRIYKLMVVDMEISIDKDELSKKLWRLGCTSLQISQITGAFEQNSKSLNVDDLARLLLSYGMSRSLVLSFLRELGMHDEDLLKLFARLQARSMGVSPSQLATLVVNDES
ncbi:MAG: ATP-binding protein [Candidatus Micrarchaeia archaeon]